MIALRRLTRTRPERAAFELAEMRRRVTRMRREVQALQVDADALYGEPEDAWRDPQAVAHG
ncbi:hypothetical protein [Actinomadura sp. WMMA1423]|uniref:hypothetical protein n=1 Tax=Actinomadura sp. WMMA1423 TaxID=2591108 RepID=UPI0011465325|nr:hypothetical protein [Actinomadura sp. WMMA1423]